MNTKDLYVILDGVKHRPDELELPKFGIYEVMRLRYRGPLFFEEHTARLNHSLSLQNRNIQVSEEEIRHNIYALIEANGNLDLNITVYVTGDSSAHRIYCYYSKTVYTPAEAYKNGVVLKKVEFERLNPGSKSFTVDMKALRDKLAQDDCYDYVLVDGEGRVREASKSNLFFYKGNKVYTASDDKVLSGITRKKVLSLLQNIAYVEYREVSVEELESMDGAFLSGTSPGVLPIAKIDDVCYDRASHHLAEDLMRAYEDLIEDYYRSRNFFAPFREKLFKRQLPLFGVRGDQKLASARIMVVGLGGVGAAAAEALARCGVGEIILVDYDVIEYSNINRQLFATYDEVGKPKVEAARARLRSINPGLRLVTVNLCLTDENLGELATYKPDYILDAIDCFGAKIALIQWAGERKIPIISSCGMASKLDPTKLRLADIYETTICPLAKKMRKALKEEGMDGLEVVYSVEEGGIIKTEEGALASVSFVPPQAGYMMAAKAINTLVFTDIDEEEVCQSMK